MEENCLKIFIQENFIISKIIFAIFPAFLALNEYFEFKTAFFIIISRRIMEIRSKNIQNSFSLFLPKITSYLSQKNL